MNVLARIIRFIVVLFAGVWLVRKLIGWLAGNAKWRRVPPKPANPFPGKTLHRDPCCGTFVSEEISVPAEAAGRRFHFCTESCRDKYLKLDRKAALEIRA